jgi:hypothetical protein
VLLVDTALAQWPRRLNILNSHVLATLLCRTKYTSPSLPFTLK